MLANPVNTLSSITIERYQAIAQMHSDRRETYGDGLSLQILLPNGLHEYDAIGGNKVPDEIVYQARPVATRRSRLTILFQRVPLPSSRPDVAFVGTALLLPLEL